MKLKNDNFNYSNKIIFFLNLSDTQFSYLFLSEKNFK